MGDALGQQLLALDVTLAGDHVVAFEEAQVVLICKKIYVDDLKPEKIPQQWKDKFYGDGDYHRIYTGQVLSVYVKE